MATYTKSQAKKALQLLKEHGNPETHYTNSIGNMVLSYPQYILEITKRGRLIEN
jgi:hypothetical protein